MPMRKWFVLAVLCSAQFINVLNFQSITLILPIIEQDLQIRTDTAQWVVSANILAFGGGLLTAGRIADYVGHRRLFLYGVQLYALSALICGLSTVSFLLIGARVVQGISTAMMLVSAFALLIDTFPEGRFRNRALSVWTAIGPLGGILGTLLGSKLADSFGWQWMFFLNIPLSLVILLCSYVLLPHTSARQNDTPFDTFGAILATASILALIMGLTQISNGINNLVVTISLCAGSLLLLILFCWYEAKITYPLVPMDFFRSSTITGANLISLLYPATSNTPLLFFTLYMQIVRGSSSFETGLAFIPTNIMIVIGSFIGARCINFWGYKYSLLLGTSGLIIAALLYTRMTVDGEYMWTLFPALIAMGTALGFVNVSVMSAGTAGVQVNERGFASGVLNMTSQLGTSIGFAILISIANLGTGTGNVSATDLVTGYQWAFYGGALFSLIALLVALFYIKSTPSSPNQT